MKGVRDCDEIIALEPDDNWRPYPVRRCDMKRGLCRVSSVRTLLRTQHPCIQTSLRMRWRPSSTTNGRTRRTGIASPLLCHRQRVGLSCQAAPPRAILPFLIRPPFGPGSKPRRAAWVRHRDAPAALRAYRWPSLPPWRGTSKHNRSGPRDSPTMWVRAPRRC